MDKLNSSKVTEFILLGFPLSYKLKRLLFTFVLASYCVAVVANSVIIIVVRKYSSLYIPMYIFLSNFSLMEIGCTTVYIPKMLADLLTMKGNISIQGCLTQFYFILFTGSMENILLAVMGYDRYLAICNPLRYSSIMTHTLCYWMALGSWTTSFLFPLVPTIFISQLNFCGPKDIDHFFCDFGPLIKLSCSDTAVASTIFFGEAWILILSCFFVTTVSYFYIISSILKIQSITGRQKAFSTCASHFIVVSIFYGSIIFMYVRPSAVHTSYVDKTVSVFYSVVTPFLNPIIYSLRNAKIREKLWWKIQRQHYK